MRGTLKKKRMSCDTFNRMNRKVGKKGEITLKKKMGKEKWGGKEREKKKTKGNVQKLGGEQKNKSKKGVKKKPELLINSIRQLERKTKNEKGEGQIDGENDSTRTKNEEKSNISTGHNKDQKNERKNTKKKKAAVDLYLCHFADPPKTSIISPTSASASSLAASSGLPS